MIELINIGISAADLVAKINEIIAAVNSLANVSDYEQLTNKPTLNGVEISGALVTKDVNINLADTDDYASVVASLATKAEVQTAQETAVSTAQANATALVAGKMDVDPTNVNEATMLSGNAYVYVYGDGALKKVKLSTLTSNVALTMETKDSYDSAVAKQKRILTLSGDQNGNNVDYTCKDGYVTGTSDLYLNGQRLVRGTDYVENTSYSLTMLTQIPVSTDRMVFVAVPLS